MLKRTKARWVYNLKSLTFDFLNLQQMIEQREKHQLEDSMGFRGMLDEHRRFQFEFLKSRGLKPTNSFLEIGCGPLTGGLPIIDYLKDGAYVGVDIRSSVLNLAWREVGKAGLSAKNPRLIRSDDFGMSELGVRQFDFVLSYSVLFHLADDQLRTYFETVAKRLGPGGQAIANINTVVRNGRWLEFPFLKRTVDEYAEVAGTAGLTTRNLGTVLELGFRQRWGGDFPLLCFTKSAG